MRRLGEGLSDCARGNTRQCWQEAFDCCNRSGINPSRQRRQRLAIDRPREACLPPREYLALGSVSMFLDTVRYASGIFQARRLTKQTMQATRYGCDLAGVLQTHPDLGPAWLPIYGRTTVFFRGYDSGGRVGRAWPSTTPYPLRSSLRRTGRRRLTLVGGVSWGLRPMCSPARR